MELRPYQNSAIVAVAKNFATQKETCLSMPTGSGKTVTFSALVSRTLAKSPFSRVLLLFHRFDLLFQAAETLKKFSVNFDCLADKKELREVGLPYYSGETRCTLAMVQTFKNASKAGKLPKTWKLVIIDECHFGNFYDVREHVGNDAYILGVTATPISTRKSTPLATFYKSLVADIDIPFLLEQGFLVEPRQFEGVAIERKNLKKDNKGEFTDASQIAEFSKRKVLKGINMAIEKMGNRKFLIFCVNIEHAEEVSKQVGLPAYHSKNSEKHSEIMNEFRNGKLNGIVTVAILTTGFDFPQLSGCILLRATGSLSLYLQMIGRIVRPFAGKPEPIVVDLGGNASEFGLWCAKRDWHSLFHGKEISETAGVAPTKKCPKCESFSHATAKICKYCDFVFPEKSKKEIEISHLREVEKNEDEEFCKNLAYKHAENGGNHIPYVAEIKARAGKNQKKLDKLLRLYAENNPRILKKNQWVYIQKQHL